MAPIYIIDGIGDTVIEVFIRGFLLVALALFVVVTAKLGKPRRREGVTEFPPSWGTKIILWIAVALLMLMAWVSVDVGMSWLAFLLLLVPLLMLWRWPAVIVVDEVRIEAVAPFRSRVVMAWSEVVAVEPSAAGDAVIVRSRSGEKIKVPFSQVGAEELVGMISDLTEFECRYEEPSLY